jgi:hypothetical protein
MLLRSVGVQCWRSDRQVFTEMEVLPNSLVKEDLHYERSTRHILPIVYTLRQAQSLRLRSVSVPFHGTVCFIEWLQWQ